MATKADNAKPLVFQTDDYGETFVVQEWFPVTRMSCDLLADVPEVETVITFRVKNGTRKYRVVDVIDNRDIIAEILQEDGNV